MRERITNIITNVRAQQWTENLAHKYQQCTKLTFISLMIVLSLVTGLSIGKNITIPPELIEVIIKKHGPGAKQRVLEWEQLIRENQNESELGKLKVVNRFFNNIKYAPDSDSWGERNYWATPVEFISHDAGDCEDYAIAKYFTLKALGVPTSKMRLAYVKALKLNQAHMVLTYYETPSGEPLVLDNVRKYILYASERPDLQPVYSFNGDGLWLTKDIKRKKGKKVGKDNKMKLWLDLKRRMDAEGIQNL